MLPSDVWAVLNPEEMHRQREKHLRFNDVIGDITVDTCYAADRNYYECGIERDGTWYIVSKNIPESKLEAVHNKWVKEMKENPKRELKDMHSEDGDDLE